MQTRERAARSPRPVEDRLAGAPMSWGVCEVPGRGALPSLESVLCEMEAVGLRGTELGAPGSLPSDALVSGYGITVALHRQVAKELAAEAPTTTP
jgi:hypothetical protein